MENAGSPAQDVDFHRFWCMYFTCRAGSSLRSLWHSKAHTECIVLGLLDLYASIDYDEQVVSHTTSRGLKRPVSRMTGKTSPQRWKEQKEPGVQGHSLIAFHHKKQQRLLQTGMKSQKLQGATVFYKHVAGTLVSPAVSMQWRGAS